MVQLDHIGMALHRFAIITTKVMTPGKRIAYYYCEVGYTPSPLSVLYFSWSKIL